MSNFATTPDVAPGFRQIDSLDQLGASAGPHRLPLGQDMLSLPPAPLFDSAALPSHVVAEHASRAMVPGPQFLAVTGHELGSTGVLQQDGRLFLDRLVMPPGFGGLTEPDGTPSKWVKALLSDTAEIIALDQPIGVVLNPHLVWGHFLLEMLGRLYLMAKLRALGRPMPIAVPSGMPGWVHDVIAAYFGRDEIIVYSARTQRVRAPCFVLPGMLMADYHLHPEMNMAVADLQRRVLGTAPPPPDLPRRLYLSRGQHKTATHLIANEAEVAATLGALGFTTIHPQQLTLREQLALYAGAECIVAQFSSAAHNALFAPRGTPVFVFGWMNPLQSRIAALRGQPLAYMAPSDQALVYPSDDKRPPVYRFSIDCAELARTLPAFRHFAG